MSEQTKSAKESAQQKEYYVGEVATQTEQVVARPDGTAISDRQWQVEVINKLNQILTIIRDRL